MAHIEKKDFQFGTLLIRAEILKARAGELEDRGVQEYDKAGRAMPQAPLTDAEIYTHQTVVGVNEVCYNVNVGGEPDWQLLEKGLDLQELFQQIEDLENKIKGLNMENGRLKKQIETLGLVKKET